MLGFKGTGLITKLMQQARTKRDANVVNNERTRRLGTAPEPLNREESRQRSAMQRLRRLGR